MKVRYYGHVGQSTGYGRAASDLCMALLGAGVELEIRPLSPPNKRVFDDAYLPLARLVRTEGQLDPRPDAVIVHTTPVDCNTVRGVVMDGPTRTDAPWIAYTTWEALTRPPMLRAALYDFQQVWHPSRANAEALAARGPAKILPHCFDPATFEARRSRPARPRANPERYAFYFVGAWSERKAPDALVDTFIETFSKFEPVHLFIHSAGADVALIDKALDRVVATSGAGSTHFSHGHVSEDDVLRMHTTYDCFVTASKGEAWNLPCFDAMLAGRQIIAPLGQGSDDYLAGTDAGIYGTNQGRMWTEPDLGMLSIAMRKMFASRLRDLTVEYDPRTRYGYPAVAQLAITYLSECYS